LAIGPVHDLSEKGKGLDSIDPMLIGRSGVIDINKLN